MQKRHVANKMDDDIVDSLSDFLPDLNKKRLQNNFYLIQKFTMQTNNLLEYELI